MLKGFEAMNDYLYRGISVLEDEDNNGRIILKGVNKTDVPECGQQGVECGEGYEAGYSELNAVRTHQYDSSMKKLAYVSVTTDYEIAKKFATFDNHINGYVYTIDPKLFLKHGINTFILESHDSNIEREVTLSTVNGGQLPDDVIVKKVLIQCT